MNHRGPRVVLAFALLLITACTTAPGPTGTPSLPPPPTASPVLAPTTSPSPTAPPTLPPSPASAPAATPAAGHPVIDLFLSDFAAVQPPFHVFSDIVGTVSAGTQELEIGLTVEGDISGQDFDGRVSGNLIGQTIDTRVILVDGVAYNQSADGSWAQVGGFQQTQPLNPFSRLNAADLTYGGTVSRDGRTLHRLTTGPGSGKQ